MAYGTVDGGALHFAHGDISAVCYFINREASFAFKAVGKAQSYTSRVDDGPDSTDRKSVV